MSDQVWLEAVLGYFLIHSFEIPPAGLIVTGGLSAWHWGHLQAELGADDLLRVQVQQALALDEAAFFVRLVGEVMLANQPFTGDYRLAAASAGAIAGKPA